MACVVDRKNVALRYLIFPLLLGAVYAAQTCFPEVFEYGALWSDRPKWWQFFTNGFLSGNLFHLLVNMCGIWFVYSQLASQIRISFLLVYFILFSAASSFLYFTFCMSPQATLVGASSGVYSLLGFLSWFLRRSRVGFFGLRSLSASVLPLMVFLLMLEFFAAKFWIPVMAWQLHLIAFGLAISVALAIHAVYALIHWLAERERLIFRKVFRPGALVLRQVRQLVTVPGLVAD